MGSQYNSNSGLVGFVVDPLQEEVRDKAFAEIAKSQKAGTAVEKNESLGGKDHRSEREKLDFPIVHTVYPEETGV